MKREPAFIIREGSSTVRGYKYGAGPARSAEYCLSWYPRAGARRCRETRTGERAARARAREIAVALANGRAEVLELTGADRETYFRIKAIAEEIATPALDLIEQAAAAKRIIGGHSLVEAANYFERGYITHKTCPASAQVLAELLDSFDRPRSYRYANRLKRDVGRFAEAFPNLLDATEERIRAWLRSLQLGPRRRDNIRDAIVRLSSFAKSKGYLPSDRKSEAQKVERIWEGSDVSTFTPEEVSQMLEHIAPRWKPWMLIGAFAGLRTTEIFRLDWSAVKLDQRVIAVSRRIARKVRISRLVPIADNLLAWLERYRTMHGRLYPNDNEKTLERSLEREIDRLERACGIKWKRNGLRHSFGSNRLAIVKSFAQVAIEMGNSPDKVRENYNDPKSEREGLAYFAITPPESLHNVVPMPLPLEFR